MYVMQSAEEAREASRESIANALMDAIEAATKSGRFFVKSYCVPEWLALQLLSKGYMVKGGSDNSVEVSWEQKGDL